MSFRLLSLRVYYFVSFASLGILIPFFPRWLESRDLRGAAMGAVMALVPAMGLIAPPVFGFVADTFALRGRLLAIACGGAGLAFSAVALASARGSPLGLGGLFIAVAVYAFFRAPMVPLVDVIAMEEVRTGSVTYARLRLFGSLGFLVTALVVGSALDPADSTSIPLAMAGCLLAATLVSFTLPARAPEKTIERAASKTGLVRELVASPDFRLFLAVSFLSQAAHSNFDLCFSLHLRDIGLSGPWVGSAWAMGVFSEILLMAFGARIFERFRPPRLLVAALVGASIRWLFIAAVRDERALLAAQPMHALSFGLMWLSSVNYIRGRVPPRVLATAQGLFMGIIAAASVAGNLAWGTLYRYAGGSTTFAVAAAISACGAALAVVLSRRTDATRRLDRS